jgi:hypothetical protein
MLEIIALGWLTTQIGKALEGKGRAIGWYKVLGVALWFIGEIVGMLIGLILSGGEASMLAYIFALAGAVAGGTIAYQIAKGMEPLVSQAGTESTYMHGGK